MSAPVIVMSRGFVEVEGAGDRHDAIEVRRPLDGKLPSEFRRNRGSNHADIASGILVLLRR